MSRHLSTRKMTSKSMHAFLSNLANRQTDRQQSQSVKFTSLLSEVNKKMSHALNTKVLLYCCIVIVVVSVVHQVALPAVEE